MQHQRSNRKGIISARKGESSEDSDLHLLLSKSAMFSQAIYVSWLECYSITELFQMTGPSTNDPGVCLSLGMLALFLCGVGLEAEITRGCQTVSALPAAYTRCPKAGMLQLSAGRWQAPPQGPLLTLKPHTWLAHALLDTFQLGGSQGAGLLRKAAASLLGQLPEAGAGPGAGPDLHTDRHFLKVFSETEIVANRILPAFRSRPEKRKVLSVDRRKVRGWGFHVCMCV